MLLSMSNPCEKTMTGPSARIFVIQLLAIDVRERDAVLLYSDRQAPIVQHPAPARNGRDPHKAPGNSPGRQAAS